MTDSNHSVSQEGYPHLEGDHIVRALAFGGQIRAVAIDSTEMVRELQRIHALSPVVTAALGRLAMGAQLLSTSLDDGESMTVIVRGNGPIGSMTAVSDHEAYVRALVTNTAVPSTYLQPGKLNVGAAVGEGSLTVIRERKGRSPQVGVVELISGEIAEDLTYYLASSEQIPSVVALGVRMAGEVSEAAGLLVQVMPGATEETITHLETRVAGFPDVTQLLAEGFSAAQLIDLLLGDPQIDYLSCGPSGYRCTCSLASMERALLALPRNDQLDLAKDAKGIDITCDFCRTPYHFSQTQLRELSDRS